jgi:putative Mg2+ transporter-C (MgtC) family protein
MPLTLGWREIVPRLFFTILAGGLIGWNRGEHGHPAGLRTTILVCLAASLSMIETNLLLDTRGKPPDSFAVLDLARFPLGILSGMGFIGAGAILRRGNMVAGLTTAATLWFVTMIGLCIGGGQIAIGVVGACLGYIVLIVLKWVEDCLPIERHATMDLVTSGDTDIARVLAGALAERGYQVVERAGGSASDAHRRHYRYRLSWRASSGDPGPGELLGRFAGRDGVLELNWQVGA